jgi:simple sugar transport system ATP-binding protein
MREEARKSFGILGSIVQSVDVPVAALSGGQRQSVAVGRAAAWADRVVFMDEPTAALGVVQTEKVLQLIRRVAEKGIAVVLVSHNMPQVLEVSDRIEVLRLGRRVARFTAGETNVEQLVAALTGGFTNEPAPAGVGGAEEAR